MSTKLRAVASIASAVILAACSSSGTSSVPPAPSLAPTSPPSAIATPSPTEGAHFTFDHDAVVTTTTAGFASDLYINPGALIEVDGTLHMFPNVFSKWPGVMKIPHLTSTDGGTTWVLDKADPVIGSDDIPLANPGVDISTGYVADDGTWVLIYSTVDTSKPWVLGRATAPGPSGPWTFDAEPILEPGPAGAFDHGGVEWPSVVKRDGTWVMYYAGFDQPQSGTGAIGMATLGADGTWTKQAEPVLVASEKWEGRSLDRPRVVVAPGGLVTLYTGRDLTDRGLATSTDGRTWTKLPGPQIEHDDFPDTTKRSWDSALLLRDGKLVYFLEIGFQTTAIYRALLDSPA
jgi:predicted GH43/DUF377 family glycosyl hydrolase